MDKSRQNDVLFLTGSPGTCLSRCSVLSALDFFIASKIQEKAFLAWDKASNDHVSCCMHRPLHMGESREMICWQSCAKYFGHEWWYPESVPISES